MTLPGKIFHGPGALLFACRLFIFTADGITPAMAAQMPEGKGSRYQTTYKDSEGRPLDGNKTYKLNVLPKVPVALFWAVTVYDPWTRSEIQSQPYPSISSQQDPAPVTNKEGSLRVPFIIRWPGKVLDGYFVKQTQTYGHWVIWRGFQENGDPAPAVEKTKKLFKMYPLSQKDNPPKMNFVDASGKFNSTIHRSDDGIWEELNEVVQAEPSEGQDPEILGLLASLGIQKGLPFKPDARMQKILKDAANVAAVTARTITSRPNDMFKFYPGESVWTTPFPGGSYEFLDNGARVLDASTFMHFYATGITPAMTMKMVGKGSQYAVTYLDKNSDVLDGGKTYKIHLPKDVPAKDFWSFTLYDNQTRSQLQTDQQFPTLGSQTKGVQKNKDGSYDIYFAPKPPKGNEGNWLQTIPGKSWWLALRMYGPQEAWIKQTWRPSELELVK